METERKQAKAHNNKNKKFTLIAWVMAILVFVVAIPINLVFDRLNLNIDLSSNELYTLTDTTTDYLATIPDKHIQIYLLVDFDDLRADQTMIAMTRTLEQYEAYDNIEIIDFYANEHPEIINELNPNGYYNLKIADMLVRCTDTGMIKKVAAKQCYTGVTDESNNVISAAFHGENLLTAAIQYTVNGQYPTIHFLTGHGEKTPDDCSILRATVGNANYQTAELNLLTETAVPDDAHLIIVAAPKQDITDAELEKLNAYLDKGGNISFLMPPNEAKIRYANIERILLDYCLAMNYDRVYETEQAAHISGDPYTIIANLEAIPEENGYADLTSALLADDDLVPIMPPSRSFSTIYGSNYTSLEICSLLTTNTTAIGEVYGGTDEDPDETVGTSMVLSAYSQDNSRNESKVFVIGNADFIDDDYLKESYGMDCVSSLFLSSVTWMYNSDINLSLSKDKTYDYLLLNSESAANRTLYLFIGVPVVIAALGVFVWWRRKNS